MVKQNQKMCPGGRLAIVWKHAPLENLEIKTLKLFLDPYYVVTKCIFKILEATISHNSNTH